MTQSPRRVMFLSSCVRGGGAGWSLYYLLKHLDRSRIEPLVVVPSQGIFRKRFQQLGVRVVEMPRLTERTSRQVFRRSNPVTVGASYLVNSLSAVSAVPLLARVARVARVEAIHCNNMLVKTLGSLAARKAGVPAVLHVRNVHEKKAKVILYGNLARLGSVRSVLANSIASAGPYRRYVPEKVTVVYNGIDLEEFHPGAVPGGEFRRELGVDERTRIVGFTGNLIPRKGLETLLQAAAALLATHERVLFVAMGSVPLGDPPAFRDRLESLALELGIAGRFRFAGFREDIRTAVVDFDVLVLPSLQEPFGRSVIEAMALGTPVVASRVGGVPEIITHGRDGILVEPGDVSALAEAVGSLLANAPERKKYSSAGLDTVRQRFNVALLTRDTEDLILAAIS